MPRNPGDGDGSIDSSPLDPTIERLYNNDKKNTGSSGNLYAYPLDILNDETPGHFIMIQAFDVQGIQLEKLKKIFQARESLSADQTRLDEAREQNEPQPVIRDLEERIRYQQSLLQSIIADTPFRNNGIGMKDSSILDQDNTLNNAFDTNPQVDQLGRVRTLQDTIVLYMPETVQAIYGAEYSLDSNSLGYGIRAALDAFSGAVASGGAVRGASDQLKIMRDLALQNPEASLAGAGAAIGAVGGGAIGGAVIGAVGGNVFKGTVSALTRRVVNPSMEFLFKSVNQRTFQYIFNFAPTSKKEAEAVHKIIKSFKWHAHPTVDSIHAFLKMPSEFDIVFYSNMKENQYLNRVMPCALTGMEVNYTPDGTTSFFQDDGDKNGQPPTRTTLTLTFQEITVMDRRHIDAGY